MMPDAGLWILGEIRNVFLSGIEEPTSSIVSPQATDYSLYSTRRFEQELRQGVMQERKALQAAQELFGVGRGVSDIFF